MIQFEILQTAVSVGALKLRSEWLYLSSGQQNPFSLQNQAEILFTLASASYGYHG